MIKGRAGGTVIGGVTGVAEGDRTENTSTVVGKEGIITSRAHIC
jgi:hypothetical protein